MPPENNKKPVIRCEKKQKKRPCNIDFQGFIKERFLVLQKEQIENQKAQEEYQDNFSKNFLTKREKWRLRNEIKIVNYIYNLPLLLKRSDIQSYIT